MKFVALVSGGKDSFYAIMEAIRNGHELIACAHLAPRASTTPLPPGQEAESYMYQTAASECIPIQVQECLGVPLLVRVCHGTSRDTSLVYDDDARTRTDTTGTGTGTADTTGTEVTDEVEDLYELLVQVKKQYPTVEGISSGAILSTYQRTRIESVCSRLNLTSLGYLWRIGPQRNLLECMLQDGMEAVLVKVASPPGLIPLKHLNQTLGTMHYSGILDRLKDKYDMHVCGEGGEFETLVLDCPLFQKRLVLVNVEIIETEDGVGVLYVRECRAEEKEEPSSDSWKTSGLLTERIVVERCDDDDDTDDDNADNDADQESTVGARSSMEGSPEEQNTNLSPALVPVQTTPQMIHLPHVKILPGGLAHISEIISQSAQVPSTRADLSSCDPDDLEAELAVLEAKSIFSVLKRTLSCLNWNNDNANVNTNGTCTQQKQTKEPSATAKDVVFVHLYLSNIAHFAKINIHYKNFFGTILPPSRSCVAVGKALPGRRRVLLDCIVQRGSGDYMRNNQPEITESSSSLQEVPDSAVLEPKSTNTLFVSDHKKNPHHNLRSTLHVQSISHWAPICVGPYSQANTLRSSITFLAGQIGLVPATMKLIEGGWSEELKQSWKNAACVLDALGGDLSNALGGVVYLSSDVVRRSSDAKRLWKFAEHICCHQIRSNAGIIEGWVDEKKKSEHEEKYGGYEDFETWKEMTGGDGEHINEITDEAQYNEIPILMVALPQMPVGAVSEVELICTSSTASSCLQKSVSCSWEDERHIAPNGNDNQTGRCGNVDWDLGNNGILYDTSTEDSKDDIASDVTIETVVGSLGIGCAAISFITASISSNRENQLHIDSVLLDMVSAAIDSIEGNSSKLDKKYALHFRLFYVTSSELDDGIRLRSALTSAICLNWINSNQRRNRLKDTPAFSVVPVTAIHMSPSSTDREFCLALQVVAMDLIHLESKMWIHNR